MLRSQFNHAICHATLFLLLNLSIGNGAAAHAASANARRILQAPESQGTNMSSISSPTRAPASSPLESQDPPLASLGPEPADAGISLIVTLDLWGPGLLTFDIGQQQTLLQVMNETILDAYSDELQLLRVEDILPLYGPAAVSLYNTRPNTTNTAVPTDIALSSPARSPSRRLLYGGRQLLQAPTSGPLAQAGDSSNITSLPHLQLMVRISVAPGQTDLLRDEVRNAVNGPLLPELRERGVDVRYLTLSSMQVQNNAGGSPPGVSTRSSSSELGSGSIAGIVVVACLVPLGALSTFVLVRRHQRLKRQRKDLAKGSSTGSDSDIEMANTSKNRGIGLGDNMQPLMLPGSATGTPSNSLGSSGDSRRHSHKDSRPTSRVMDPEICTVPFEELQFSRVIGEGSFGRVFLGKWQETTVAIKILLTSGGPLPDDSWDVTDLSQLRDCSWSQHQQSHSPVQRLIVDELAKEASLMAKLRHPNIVMFLGAALNPPCMVTEFCARGSLLDVLHRARTNEIVRQELDWRRRLRLALDAAKGMNYLHSRQPPILHRDLKSANLLVDKHWQAKVGDFNLSRVMHSSSAMSSIAATNPRWVPPEVLVGSSHGASTDVYAFGILLWELLTWEIPWKEETPWQVVIAVVDRDQRPEIPSEDDAAGGYPVAWQGYLELMVNCWGKDPDMRPTFESIIPSMRTLIDAEDAAVATPAIEHAETQKENPIEQNGPTLPSSTSQAPPRQSPFVNMPALPSLAGPLNEDSAQKLSIGNVRADLSLVGSKVSNTSFQEEPGGVLQQPQIDKIENTGIQVESK